VRTTDEVDMIAATICVTAENNANLTTGQRKLCYGIARLVVMLLTSSSWGALIHSDCLISWNMNVYQQKVQDAVYETEATL